MRSPATALFIAALAGAPAVASISPISQARSVSASYSFESPGGNISDSQTISAGDFGPFNADISFDDVNASQYSGVNPGGQTGIYGSGFVSTLGLQDESGTYVSNATSSFEMSFALDEPMSLTGVIGATYNGGGDGYAELDVFVSLARDGGSTQTWRIQTNTGDSFTEGLVLNADLAPGTYTITALAHNNNVPVNACGFFPARSTGTFSFQVGVPAPASLAICAAALLAPRRRPRA